MYAVIRTGGKQHRVSEGDLVRVDRLAGEVGEKVVFEEVLFTGDGEGYRHGAPLLAGAKVLGEIAIQGRARKVKGIKFKRRKRYTITFGHKQPYTWVRIQGVKLTPPKVEKPEQAEPEAV
ncbi:MAG TPA: 50S ribosomal protein L21 [bacterium]|nr:50S ribosomal protein L21 [bacterium]